MLTQEVVSAHLSAAVSGSVYLRNEGWYSARYTLNYTFKGKRVSVHESNITIGTNRSSFIPDGASDIEFLVQEWWGFGWSTIFTKTWAAPVTQCFKVWGTTLDPKWEDIKCA